MSSVQVRVVIRFRPKNSREKEFDADPHSAGAQFRLEFTGDSGVKVASNSFVFDRVLTDNYSQSQVYDVVAEPSIRDILDGFNGTIFAYGQTGSGKTFTMFGPEAMNSPDASTFAAENWDLVGIVPRASHHIFSAIDDDPEDTEYTIKCSYLEIYNETLNDLLEPSTPSSALRIREDPVLGVRVENLMEISVATPEDIMDLLFMGASNRAVASTNMNATSSRSHTLFVVSVLQRDPTGSTSSGKLNLVDLAGSEKVGKTGATGQTLNEAKNINRSLSALGNCIKSLTEAGRTHIPFRDSKLTRLLQESLGGNTKVTMLVACSPHYSNAEEIISSLRFAQRAKNIRTRVMANKHKSVAELESLVASLKAEISELRGTLSACGCLKSVSPSKSPLATRVLSPSVGPLALSGSPPHFRLSGTSPDDRAPAASDQSSSWQTDLELLTQALATKEKEISDFTSEMRHEREKHKELVDLLRADILYLENQQQHALLTSPSSDFASPLHSTVHSNEGLAVGPTGSGGGGGGGGIDEGESLLQMSLKLDSALKRIAVLEQENSTLQLQTRERSQSLAGSPCVSRSIGHMRLTSSPVNIPMQSRQRRRTLYTTDWVGPGDSTPPVARRSSVTLTVKPRPRYPGTEKRLFDNLDEEDRLDDAARPTSDAAVSAAIATNDVGCLTDTPAVLHRSVATNLPLTAGTQTTRVLTTRKSTLVRETDLMSSVGCMSDIAESAHSVATAATETEFTKAVACCTDICARVHVATLSTAAQSARCVDQGTITEEAERVHVLSLSQGVGSCSGTVGVGEEGFEITSLKPSVGKQQSSSTAQRKSPQGQQPRQQTHRSLKQRQPPPRQQQQQQQRSPPSQSPEIGRVLSCDPLRWSSDVPVFLPAADPVCMRSPVDPEGHNNEDDDDDRATPAPILTTSTPTAIDPSSAPTPSASSPSSPLNLTTATFSTSFAPRTTPTNTTTTVTSPSSKTATTSPAHTAPSTPSTVSAMPSPQRQSRAARTLSLNIGHSGKLKHAHSFTANASHSHQPPACAAPQQQVRRLQRSHSEKFSQSPTPLPDAGTAASKASKVTPGAGSAQRRRSADLTSTALWPSPKLGGHDVDVDASAGGGGAMMACALDAEGNSDSYGGAVGACSLETEEDEDGDDGAGSQEIEVASGDGGGKGDSSVGMPQESAVEEEDDQTFHLGARVVTSVKRGSEHKRPPVAEEWIDLAKLDLDVSVERTQVTEYTTYFVVVRSRVLAHSWQVSRRYREFDELRDMLVKRHSMIKMFPFPAKKLIGSNQESVVKERRVQLAQFLRGIVAMSDLRACVELLRFLDVRRGLSKCSPAKLLATPLPKK